MTRSWQWRWAGMRNGSLRSGRSWRATDSAVRCLTRPALPVTWRQDTAGFTSATRRSSHLSTFVSRRTMASAPVTMQAEALCRQGFALHQQGRCEAARQLYEQALQLQPRHFNALHLLGLVGLQSHQPERALE